MSHRQREHGLMRGRGDGESRVTPMELFFDLVYVFAVTQLSHRLLEHLSPRGLLDTLILLLAVWWAWVYTAWITNWFDPDQRGVRLMLIAVMLGSLLMSTVIPAAFADRGLTFALTYVAVQLGRSIFVVMELRGEPALRRNFQRIMTWSSMSGIFWVAGGFADGSPRLWLWIAAVLIDYTGPASGFVTPGLGRSTTHDWEIAGGHLAERCQLLIIVALGESILVTGATFDDLPFSLSSIAAFVVSFLGSVALWWVYFDIGAVKAGEAIETTTDPGRLGRSAYTYFHLPMIAGIIVTAVGDELTVAHPTGHTTMATALTVLGGPALFLAGHVLFMWAIFRRVSMARVVAIFVLAAALPIAASVAPLTVAIAALLTIVAVALYDTWDHRRYLAHLIVE